MIIFAGGGKVKHSPLSSNDGLILVP